MGRIGCAAVCRGLGEPLGGTAPPAAGAWLLVEHPGPWPPFGLPPALPPAVVSVLEAAEAAGIRSQFIRRPTGRRRFAPHQVYVAWSRGAEVWMDGGAVADLRALTELDLDALARGHRPGFGSPVTTPQLLVCTHGRRDACCAEFGRPIAVALAARHGDVVWETTHVGGDRFAANLVCLPYGTYHGQVTPRSADRVGDAALRGEVDLAHYRGRGGWPTAAQAAECYARQATGVRSALGVRLVALHPESADGSVVVDLRVDERPMRILVQARPSGCPRLTSCSPYSLEEPLEYELRGIDEMVS